MTVALASALTEVRARYRRVLGLARTHQFWVEFAGVGAFALVAAVSVGYAALSRTAELERQIAELERVEAGLARWQTGLRRPGPEESSSWRQSEQTLRRLAATTGEPLSVAQLVAQRGEEVGIEGMSVRVVEVEGAEAVPPVRSGPWSVGAGGSGLQVEFDGDVGDVVGFLGALPPHAVVSTLKLAAQGDALHASIVLITRTVEARS